MAKDIIPIEKNRRQGGDFLLKRQNVKVKKVDNFSELAQKKKEKKITLKQKVWDELDRQVEIMDRLTPHTYGKWEHLASLIMDARISKVDFTEKSEAKKVSQQDRRKSGK